MAGPEESGDGSKARADDRHGDKHAGQGDPLQLARSPCRGRRNRSDQRRPRRGAGSRSSRAGRALQAVLTGSAAAPSGGRRRTAGRGSRDRSCRRPGCVANDTTAPARRPRHRGTAAGRPGGRRRWRPRGERSGQPWVSQIAPPSTRQIGVRPWDVGVARVGAETRRCQNQPGATSHQPITPPALRRTSSQPTRREASRPGRKGRLRARRRTSRSRARGLGRREPMNRTARPRPGEHPPRPHGGDDPPPGRSLLRVRDSSAGTGRLPRLPDFGPPCGRCRGSRSSWRGRRGSPSM